tara:strand:+ start:14623 stop:14991 length:369 start_codon:yes stop_codon:yes gene_type:complete
MHSFNEGVEDLLAMFAPQHSEEEVIDGPFEDFRRFAVNYAMEHDSLPADHQVIRQIENSPSVDEMETLLRNNLDYCDDCMVKLFKAYFASSQEPEEEDDCGCDGGSTDEHSPFPPDVGPGCG